MDSTEPSVNTSEQSIIDDVDRPCYLCTTKYNRCRPSMCQCFHCNHPLCSECIITHQDELQHDVYNLQDRYNELTNLIDEKEKYITDTISESTEIVLSWYQRTINDLIESQAQLIENIEAERDRARDELAEFDIRMRPIGKEIQALSKDSVFQIGHVESIRIKLNDIATKLANYCVDKDVNLPDPRIFQPRYKVSYRFIEPTTEENWDLDDNDTSNIALPMPSPFLILPKALPAPTTQPLFSADVTPGFIVPTDDDDQDNRNNLKWDEGRQQQHQQHYALTDNDDDSEYFLDPRLYHLGTPRHYTYDIHLVASNGNDLLCYSPATKQLIFVDDSTSGPNILSWYHTHIQQLVWFDAIKSFVALTDDTPNQIFSIEPTFARRLKIRLRTRLPKGNGSEIIKERLFARADECYMFVYYERENEQKRLRLINPLFGCARSCTINRCFEREADDLSSIVGLCVNQQHIVFVVQSTMQDDVVAAGGAAARMSNTRLLIFDKSTICFIRRIILGNINFELPIIIHFGSLSSYSIVDQTCLTLRFFDHENEIHQIKLLPSSALSACASAISTSNIEFVVCSSIVLMNDGSLLLSNNKNHLIQLILGDQCADVDDW